MAGTTFLSLPNELICMIANFCQDTQDAYLLCFVNQRILPSAQRALYRTIIFWPAHYNQVVILIRTLVENPHLRGLVRGLVIFQGADIYYDVRKMKTPTNLAFWHNSKLDESRLSGNERHILLLCRQYMGLNPLSMPLIVGLMLGLLLCFVNRIEFLEITQVEFGPRTHDWQLAGFKSILALATSSLPTEAAKPRVCPELKRLSLVPS
ncbi:hypothetical protein BDP81DRAFT_107835 [Colletotrichum phormii]|uniref:Uncharacterized protein n=1 Tax=Colletotrichum phormii TaxID=359342 RepID=A0AAI9ZHX1_9PEZI|nr:uncharacterized protein BDP81DRAFT_107835 [Colletotrichum phormii]KAK1624791.1 hypothetical protein BDP81DRAFT_107835 [Colletotrichum phormii]